MNSELHYYSDCNVQEELTKFRLETSFFYLYLKHIVLDGVEDEFKGLVPLWIDVVVYMSCFLSALWGSGDEQLHIWVGGIHYKHV